MGYYRPSEAWPDENQGWTLSKDRNYDGRKRKEKTYEQTEGTFPLLS